MDLKSPVNRQRLFWIGFGALTLIALVLRTLALLLTLDAEIGYFASDAALPKITRTLECDALLLCFISLALFAGQKLPEHHSALHLSNRVAAGIAAASFCATAIYLFTHLTSLPAPTVLVLAAAVFAIIGAFFFIQLLRGQEQSAALCGYGVIFAAVLMLSITYFDRYTQMNTPHKVSLHLAMLSIMLCMLFEIRILIGRGKPRGLTVASAICAFCTVVFGGSNLIAFLSGVYTDSLYLMGDLMALGFAVYLICRTVGDLLSTVPSNTAETEQES